MPRNTFLHWFGAVLPFQAQLHQPSHCRGPANEGRCCLQEATKTGQEWVPFLEIRERSKGIPFSFRISQAC